MTEKEKLQEINLNGAEVLALLKTKIKKLREQSRYSQEDVSKLMGMSASGFAKIETGGNDITITRLVQIANILQVSLTDLLDTKQTAPTYHTQAQQIITGVLNGTNYGTVQQDNESNRQLIDDLHIRLETMLDRIAQLEIPKP